MTQPDAPKNDLPIEVQVEDLQQLLAGENQGQATDLVLLDCREPAEHAFCRIEGATLVPMNQTPEVLDQLQQHPGSRLIIYCHHGIRSLQVAHYLRQNGCGNAQSMAGGIDRWSQKIDSDVPRY